MVPPTSRTPRTPRPGPPSRRAVLGALCVPFAGAAAACMGRDWGAFPRTELTFATGNPGGVFARYGEVLSTVISRKLDGVTCTAELTDASVENLRRVHDGSCDLGFTLGDAAADAIRGRGSFAKPLDVVALARTYDSFVHLVVRGDSPIRSVHDLRGHRVGVGSDGSGTRVVAERVLRHSGVSLSEISPSSVPLQACADALLAGQLAAFFFVSGFPSEAVRSLSRRTQIRLVGLKDVAEAMTETYGSVYVAGPVPASAYDLADAVDTISVRNYLVAGRGMPERLAYAVTRVMFDTQREIGRLAPRVRQPSIGAAVFTSPLELHPGAERYFRERRS